MKIRQRIKSIRAAFTLNRLRNWLRRRRQEREERRLLRAEQGLSKEQRMAGLRIIRLPSKAELHACRCEQAERAKHSREVKCLLSPRSRHVKGSIAKSCKVCELSAAA